MATVGRRACAAFVIWTSMVPEASWEFRVEGNHRNVHILIDVVVVVTANLLALGFSLTTPMMIQLLLLLP